jgi:heme-degrading monooxygenase HmoA
LPVLEVAILDIKSGSSLDEFEAAFRMAERILSSMKGYVSHELLKCIEKKNRYILLVKWERLEDHVDGFRKAARYQEWKELLHHFCDPFPVVEHYEVI